MRRASVIDDIIREGELKQRGPTSLLVPIPCFWWARAKWRNRRRAFMAARDLRRWRGTPK